MKAGPTGKYPGGKISDDDDGEIVIGIKIDNKGLVHIDFGKPVHWIAMPRADAAELAQKLLIAATSAGIRLKEET
jgi:hypothetical protein